MADVTVTFAADTTALDAAIAKVKTEMQGLGRAGGGWSAWGSAGGGGGGGGFGGPGGAGPPPIPPGTINSVNQLASAQNSAAQSARNAGINIGNMLERIAIRFAIFEAVRLAIQGLMASFKEVSGFEIANVHFENMTKGAEDAAAAESALQSTVKATNQEYGKLFQTTISMEDAGAGIIEATADTDLLGKRATATGQDVTKLGEALKAAKLNEATIPQMYELAHATGTAKDALLDEVDDYVRLTEGIKETERGHAALVSQIEIGEREWEKEGEVAQRTAEREIQAQERVLAAKERTADRALAAFEREEEAAQRVADRQLSIAEKIAQAAGGRTDGDAALRAQVARTPALEREYERGVKALAQEEGVKAEDLVRRKIIGVRDVMAAGRAAMEEERRNIEEARREQRQADEDHRREIEDQARASKQAREDLTRGFQQMAQATKDLYASQKQQEAVVLDKEKLQINQDLVKAMGDQNNIQGELAKTMRTVSEEFASIVTSIKQAVDENKELLSDMRKAAAFAGKHLGGGEGTQDLYTRDVMGFLGNISGISGIVEALKNLFPPAMAEDTKRTADGVTQLNQTLTGH